ncbi:Leucine-rich repeat domain, L domain-like [Phytophthora cactorum]|nr:Leucine-rich repeat domain, L domain-like [Phytophthora cactorum]
MGTKQQPARPPHGVAVKQSPLTARARRLETTAFLARTSGAGRTMAPRRAHREHAARVRTAHGGALDTSAERNCAVGLGRQQSPTVGLAEPKTGRLGTCSRRRHRYRSVSLRRVAAAAASAGQDGWKAFKVAHRSNKVLTKTRQMISVLTCQNSSKKNENDGEDQHSHADGNAGTSGDEADPNEKEEETEEMRIAAAAAAKLMEAKAKFQREVLDEDTSQGSSTNGVGDVQNGAEDFWRLYKNSTTSKRPDSTRGRFIANCQNSSLLVLPVLDLKRPSRYEQASQALCYDNYYFGDKRAEALGDALQLLPLPIQTLSMKNVGVSGSGSSAIMSGIAMKQLKHLIFSENRLGTKGILTIYRMLENPQINLKSLDLGNNQLGDQAVRTLIQCLLNRCTLEHLDLRCNHIFHAAVSIGELLRITTPLASLNLSWNNIRAFGTMYDGKPDAYSFGPFRQHPRSNGKAAADLGACLATNKSLRFLDISNNHVQAKSMLVYVNGLQQNTVLESLIIRGNPIGVLGENCSAFGSISNCQIDIGDCNLEILDGNLEGTIYGGGTFNLNLTERSDSILLRELLQLVWKNKTDIVDSLHNGAVFTFNRKDEKALTMTVVKNDSPDGFDRVVTLIDRSFGHSQDGDEAAKFFVSGPWQKNIPLRHRLCREKMSLLRITMCINEIPNQFFEDKDGDGKIDVCGDICMTIGLENLSDIEQSHVEQKVGKWISFNVNNPIGRYQLNMANSIDRRILMRLLEVNKTERKLRQQLKLMDTSQYGLQVQPLQGGFRNMRLNRLPIVMGNNWQFPRLGILEFDFVMTRRPYAI